MALGLIEDNRATALGGLHVVSFDTVAGFETLAAWAREPRKPIFAMKAGRSEQARQATVRIPPRLPALTPHLAPS